MRISDWSSDVCSSDLVGQGDAHVASARPDVQRVGLDADAAVAGRRDFKLLVAMAEPLGPLAKVAALAHLRAQRGAGAVAADQGGERARWRFHIAAGAEGTGVKKTGSAAWKESG